MIETANDPPFPIQPAEPSGVVPTNAAIEGDVPALDPALERFWVAVKRLPRYARFVYGMTTDERVPKQAKAALAVGGVYAVSPVDLVPGIIPVAGQLDDLVVLLLAIRMAIRACPPQVAAAHLERAGLSRTDIDDDLRATKDTAKWLAGKGLRASRAAARTGGRRLAALWRAHRPGRSATG